KSSGGEADRAPLRFPTAPVPFGPSRAPQPVARARTSATPRAALEAIPSGFIPLLILECEVDHVVLARLDLDLQWARLRPGILLGHRGLGARELSTWLGWHRGEVALDGDRVPSDDRAVLRAVGVEDVAPVGVRRRLARVAFLLRVEGDHRAGERLAADRHFAGNRRAFREVLPAPTTWYQDAGRPEHHHGATATKPDVADHATHLTLGDRPRPRT